MAASSVSPRAAWILFGLAMLAIAGHWVFGAMRQVLWMDEFHSLLHARAESLEALLHSVRADNHPPLSFLLLRFSRQLFGESELALRLPSLIAGLLTLLLLLRTPARPSPARGVLSACFFASSSYALLLVNDARMYACLALAVTGLWRAMESAREEGRGHRMAFLWCVIGLHTHYFFFHSALVAVLVLGVDFLRRPDRRARILRLAAWMAASLLVFAPWFFIGLQHQWGNDIVPGRSHTRPLDFAVSLAHFFFIDVGAGGVFSRGASIAGLIVLLPALTLLLESWRRRDAEDRRGLLEALAFSAGAPLIAFVTASLVSRAGYNWKYVAGAAPVTMWIVAAAFDPKGQRFGRREFLRVGSVILLIICMFFVSARSAIDPGREDHRRATQCLSLHLGAREPVFVEPTWFPDGRWRLAGWDHYAPRAGLDPSCATSLAEIDLEAIKGRVFFVLRRHDLSLRVREALVRSHRTEVLGNFGPDLLLERYEPQRH